MDALGNSAVLKRANTTWPALVTEIVHPNGGRQGATYNTQALMDTVIDYDVYYNGAYTTQKTVLEYHPVWGFVTRIAPPEGDVVEFGYDPANGNRLWQQDARGIVSRAEFLYYSGPDSVSGLLRSIKTPTQSLAGPRDSVVYDARGNLRATKTPLDRWSYFYKDLFGRDTLTVSPGNIRRGILYDLMDRDTLTWLMGDSNFVETTNVNATGIAYFYLPWAAESVFVRKTYDEEGNLTVTQGRGSGQMPEWYWLTTVWSYDRGHRMVREQHPDIAADSFVYDPAGNRTKWITRRGHHITMEYDASNRLSKRIVPEVPIVRSPSRT